MANILYTIYNNYVDSSTPNDYIENGFVKIHTFDTNSPVTPAILDEAIFGGANSTSYLVFSPAGCIYVLDNTTNAMIASFSNPLGVPEVFKKYWSTKLDSLGNRENSVDYTKFNAYNTPSTTITIMPQYFASMDGSLGNNAVGSGYLLYRDTVYPAAGNYYLLINPINRAYTTKDGNTVFPLNDNAANVNAYCGTIQHQDSACYCSNTFNRCHYASANGEGTYNTITNSVNSTTSPSAISALNALENECVCNGICQTWGGYANLTTKPQCSTNNTNVFCGVNLVASDGGQIKTGDLNIAQNCNANNSKATPDATTPDATTPNTTTPNTTTKKKAADPKSDKKKIYIAAAVIVILVIIGVIFLV